MAVTARMAWAVAAAVEAARQGLVRGTPLAVAACCAQVVAVAVEEGVAEVAVVAAAAGMCSTILHSSRRSSAARHTHMLPSAPRWTVAAGYSGSLSQDTLEAQTYPTPANRSLIRRCAGQKAYCRVLQQTCRLTRDQCRGRGAGEGTCVQSPDRAALMAVSDASVRPLHSWLVPLPSLMHGPMRMSEYS